MVHCVVSGSEDIPPGVQLTSGQKNETSLEANQYGLNELPDGCVILRTPENNSIMKFTKPLYFPADLLKKWKKIVIFTCIHLSKSLKIFFCCQITTIKATKNYKSY